MVLAVKGLSKEIGNRTILKDVSFTLERGRHLTIFGPNGAGKSTLLRILALLVRPSAGRVLIDGRDVWEAGADLRGTLGFVAHQPYLYGDLTARENLYFYGLMYGVTGLEARMREKLREVGLHLFADDPVRTYSRGMMQRLSLARATLHRPALLLLDEPYTGLDPQASAYLDGLLRRFKTEGGTTIMVSHDFEEGLGPSDEVMILDRGRVTFRRETAGLDVDSLRETYDRSVRR